MKKDSILSLNHLNLEEVASEAYHNIFSNKETIEIDGKTRRIKRTSRQGLRFLIVDEYTFLEQNPEKNSVWGKMAKDGHKILWIINEGNYIGQIRDGVYHEFHKDQVLKHSF
jgi:hypothetical protein